MQSQLCFGMLRLISEVFLCFSWLKEWKLKADKEECRRKKEETQRKKSEGEATGGIKIHVVFVTT